MTNVAVLPMNFAKVGAPRNKIQKKTPTENLGDTHFFRIPICLVQALEQQNQIQCRSKLRLTGHKIYGSLHLDKQSNFVKSRDVILKYGSLNCGGVKVFCVFLIKIL